MRSLRSLWQLVVAGILILCLTIVYLYFGPTLPDFTPGNFYSYFTIQSNILTATYFVWAAVFSWRRHPSQLQQRDSIRSMLILYMGITTSVYWLVLHRFIKIEDFAAREANMALHWLAFTALLVDSLWDRPSTRLAQKTVWLWLVYPIIYSLYTLVRGLLYGWYPYPFIDVNRLGYPLVGLITVVMGFAYWWAARLVIAGHNRLQRR